MFIQKLFLFTKRVKTSHLGIEGILGDIAVEPKSIPTPMTTMMLNNSDLSEKTKEVQEIINRVNTKFADFMKVRDELHNYVKKQTKNLKGHIFEGGDEIMDPREIFRQSLKKSEAEIDITDKTVIDLVGSDNLKWLSNDTFKPFLFSLIPDKTSFSNPISYFEKQAAKFMASLSIPAPSEKTEKDSDSADLEEFEKSKFFLKDSAFLNWLKGKNKLSIFNGGYLPSWFKSPEFKNWLENKSKELSGGLFNETKTSKEEDRRFASYFKKLIEWYQKDEKQEEKIREEEALLETPEFQLVRRFE